jgi:hypothetical protein
MGAEGGRGTLDFEGQGAVPLNFPLASTLKYIQIYFIIQADLDLDLSINLYFI